MKTTTTKKNTVVESSEMSGGLSTIINKPFEEFRAELDLSETAKEELKKVLEKEIGVDRVSSLSMSDLNKIGLLLLNILAESLKLLN